MGISIVLSFGMMASLLAGCSPKEPTVSQTPSSTSTDSPTTPSATTPAEPEQSVQAPEETLDEGPPDPQKDEFHMYDAEQLAETILDSIQKTLQEDFTLEGGDPDTLDIWYYMEGEQPLELPDIGRSWPIDQPYQWAAGQ